MAGLFVGCAGVEEVSQSINSAFQRDFFSLEVMGIACAVLFFSGGSGLTSMPDPLVPCKRRKCLFFL